MAERDSPPVSRGFVPFDRQRTEELLGMLDVRLRDRGVAASVYVVGGAAIALTVNDARRTADIDAVVSHQAVMEEATALAVAEGLPPHWLNQNAKPWIPPRPRAARSRPKQPGLVIHVAPPEHLLAMKLVALRRQDIADILDLVNQLGMAHEPPSAFADLLEAVYTGEGLLAQVLGVKEDDARAEACSIGEWVLRAAST